MSPAPAPANPCCIVCFSDFTSNSTRVSCSKCRDSFHTKCVIESLSEWESARRRRTTWQCINCRPTRKTNQTLPHACKCDITTKLEIIKLLTTDLENAQHEINSLKEEIKRINQSKLTTPAAQSTSSSPNSFTSSSHNWTTVTSKNSRKKTYAEATSPVVALQNRFNTLRTIDELTPTNNNVRKVPAATPLKKVVPKKQKRVLLVADSHGRNCGRLLQDELGPDFKCQVVCHPGAPFKQVATSAASQAMSFEADHLIVLGGTNDFRNPDQLPSLDISPLTHLPVSTRVSISHVPFRYDDSRFNRNIEKLNVNLDNVTSKSHNVDTLDLSEFTYKNHTRHGLHLNNQGKVKLCSFIARKVRAHIGVRSPPSSPSTSTTSLPSPKDNPSSPSLPISSFLEQTNQ